MKFKTLSSEYINRHQYFTARKDAYQSPTGKVVDPYFVVELPDSVVAAGITTANEVILIEQYRHPINELCIELPGGFIDPGESHEKAIARELAEETGYSFTDFHYLGKTYGNPGVLNNGTFMYLATGGSLTGSQEPDPNEEITIQLRPIEEVISMLRAGEFKQSLHELCLRRAFEWLEHS